MSDLRDAFRALRATPVVTAVAVLSLALGIRANTASYSSANALMRRVLPVQEPERLVQVLPGPERTSFSNPLWEALRDRQDQVFASAFAYSTPTFNLARGGELKPVSGIMASGRFFEVLGVPAILGRTFTAAEDAPEAADRSVAVISYAFWERQYGGAADVIGRAPALHPVGFPLI